MYLFIGFLKFGRKELLRPANKGYSRYDRRKKAELKVTGMVCAACTSAIEKSLRSLDGVSAAQVNLATEIASVTYDPEN